MSIIYGINFIPENRIIYIGQTIQKGKKRWYEHIRQAKRKEKTDKFHTFMANNGVENFSYIVLFESDDISKEELNKKEEEFILLFDTLNCGYNTYKKSGCVNLTTISRKVLWFDNNRQYQRSFISIVEAERYTGVNACNVSHCCNHLQTKTSNGWFRFENDNTPLEDSYRLGTSIRVDKLDPFTNEIIETYESLQQAEQINNITRGYLSQVCNGTRYAAKGYRYKYHNASNPVYTGSRHIKSGIAQIDPNTMLVLNKFLTCKDAALTLLVNKDAITSARHNGLKVVAGFIWVDAFDYLTLLERGEIFEDENTRRNY